MIRLLAPITKIDVQRHLVIGRLAQEVPDRAGEILDYESSKPYFKNWSDGFAKSTAAAGQEVSYGNLRAMHGKVAAGKFTRVEFNDDDKAIDVIAKVVDDNEWKKCEEGVYTAFSIGGDYVGSKKAEKINGKTYQRYTANPGEGSLVDSPCIPTAKFFEIVKADGSTLQKAFMAKKELSVAEQNARVEKVARTLARKEFWKLTGGQRVKLPEDVFTKMSGDEQRKMLNKYPPDAEWQLHVLEAVRVIKGSDYNEDEEDLEKPEEVDQEEWDDMTYEEKLDAIDEYEKKETARMKKVEDEKDLVKPEDVDQDDWDEMSGYEKRKAIEAAAAQAAKARKAAKLKKAEEDEMEKEEKADDEGDEEEETGDNKSKISMKPKDAKEAPGKDQDSGAEVEDEDEEFDEEEDVSGVSGAGKKKKRLTVEETAAKAAKAAGASEVTLGAVDELAKLLDSGKVTPEKLLELAKIEERKDVNPKEGESKYGDVTFADEKNKKYPIDTEGHIRAAWNYINKEKNAAKYSAEDAAKIKAKIVSAWKAKIDKDGPPSAEKTVTESDVEKGMYNVQSFAMALQSLANICASAQNDLDVEDDDSPIPEQLRGWLVEGTKIFCDMAEEEADELVEQLGEYAAPGAAEMAMRSLATMHKVDVLRKQLEDPDISLKTFYKIAVDAVGEDEWKKGAFFQQYVEDRAACIDSLCTKAGARHSAADKEHLQQAHDHLCKMGAKCDPENVPEEEAEKLSGKGALFKLALRSAEEISDLRKQLVETNEEMQKLRDEPVKPKGVSRIVGQAISKGKDSAQAIEAAEAAAAKAASSPPKEGVHDEKAAIAQVADMVRKTAPFRRF